MLLQCDAVLAAAAITIAAEGTGTLQFVFSGGAFVKFRPVGAMIDVTDEGTNTVISSSAVTHPYFPPDPEDLVEVTDVTWARNSRMLNSNPVPLRHYSGRHGRAMYVGFLGDVTPSSPPLDITLSNVCKTVANGGVGLSLRVRGVLYGFAQREGSYSDGPAPASSALPVP